MNIMVDLNREKYSLHQTDKIIVSTHAFGYLQLRINQSKSHVHMYICGQPKFL